MGMGFLVTGSVLLQNEHWRQYGWVAFFSLLVWPHLAYLHARYSRSPYRAEATNLLLDSAIVGMWIVLMQFNLLPSVVLAVITTHDKFSSGIRRLWLYSIAAMVFALGLTAALVQPQPVLESSLLVVICTLPVVVFHYLAVSVASYRLIRTVSRQNLQLQELRSRDAQTGLYARTHWQELAQSALLAAKHSGRPAWLLMIDIDRFKSINDENGHLVGDEVISAVGEAIHDCVRAGDSAGRYGGDEFGVVCSDANETDALAIAQRIRSNIAAVRLPSAPRIELTASVGMAPLRTDHSTLRSWLNSADMALYRAKSQGRDQVAAATDNAMNSYNAGG